MKSGCRREGILTRRFKRRAQSTIETTLALAGGVILLLGIINIFVWLNKSIVDRQVAYEATRNSPRTFINNFYQPERLNILKRY